MKNILLTVSYDGTDFCGWQKQNAGKDKSDFPVAMRTVQEEIEKALEKMLGAEVFLQGSGRTDSGVHARAQKANFISPVDSVPCENYVRALNSILPKDIRIRESQEVPEDFSARFSATSRTYRYFMHTGSVPLASDMRFVWHLPWTPDINVLNDMTSCLRGELDFATFTASGDQSLSTFRYIDDAHFYTQEDLKTGGKVFVFEITANAFLWKMVRSLTGTLIGMEKKGLGGKDFKEVLFSKDRTRAGVTAPPTGLFLWDVSFDGVRRHV